MIGSGASGGGTNLVPLERGLFYGHCLPGQGLNSFKCCTVLCHGPIVIKPSYHVTKFRHLLSNGNTGDTNEQLYCACACHVDSGARLFYGRSSGS